MPTRETLREWIHDALERVFEDDFYLIQHWLHERTICHRFALYLEENANDDGEDDWIADVEYNKFGTKRKLLLALAAAFPEESKQGRIFPDVILHLRGKGGPNLAIAEFARYPMGEYLHKKVELLTSTYGEYRYEVGVIVRLQNTFEDTWAGCIWTPRT